MTLLDYDAIHTGKVHQAALALIRQIFNSGLTTLFLRPVGKTVLRIVRDDYWLSCSKMQVISKSR
jgi:hypothetical protein